MAAQATSTVACSSTRLAPRAQHSGAKPALPKQLKHLGAGAAGLLSTTAAGAAQAAFTEPTSFGTVPELPAVSIPSVSLPDVDIPDVSGLLDNPDAVRTAVCTAGRCGILAWLRWLRGAVPPVQDEIACAGRAAQPRAQAHCLPSV